MTDLAYNEKAVRTYERTALFIGDYKMNFFEEVKAAVDINTAAEYYGLNVKKDTALCPLHNEKTASMKLYHDHLYCFGCGKHGDVIKLTGKLLGLSPIESAKRIAADFNIIVHDDYVNRSQIRNKSSPQHKVIPYRERGDRTYRLLSDYCKYLEDCQTRYAPLSPEERLHPLFITALYDLEMFRYYRDIFIYEEFEERKVFIEQQAYILESTLKIQPDT